MMATRGISEQRSRIKPVAVSRFAASDVIVGLLMVQVPLQLETLTKDQAAAKGHH